MEVFNNMKVRKLKRVWKKSRLLRGRTWQVREARLKIHFFNCFAVGTHDIVIERSKLLFQGFLKG